MGIKKDNGFTLQILTIIFGELAVK